MKIHDISSYFNNSIQYIIKDYYFVNSPGSFKKNFTSFSDYNELCKFIFETYKGRLTLGSTRAYIKGPVSCHGKDIDSIEGVTRLLPIISSWYRCLAPSNDRSEIIQLVKKAILNGTKIKGGWSAVYDYSQILCEASDVVIALWISKKEIWQELTQNQKEQIAAWLLSCTRCKYPRNNWLLFKLTIQAFLVREGFLDNVTIDDYTFIKENLYLGDGMFVDGKNGSVDYYNNWGFIYSLFWINQILPNFDPDFIKEVISLASSRSEYMLGKECLPPFYGRSVIYRLAHSCPLVANVDITEDSAISCYVMNSNYSHFSLQGSFDHGRVSYGYHKDNLNYMDDYSGIHSSLWAFRSLVLAFYLKDQGKFKFVNENKQLPIEVSDYSKEYLNGEYIVSGDSKSGITKVTSRWIRKEIYKRSIVKSILKTLLNFRKPRVGYRREFVEESFDSKNEFFK